jgi:RecB family exonuclease
MKDIDFKTLSASKLRTYLMCPRRYYYAYGEGIFQEETKATVFGSYIHAVLEDYLKHLLVTRQSQDLKGLFNAASTRKIDFTSIPETGELSLFEADVVLNRFAAGKIAYDSLFALEKFFSIEPQNTHKIKLEGRIDRIDIEKIDEDQRLLHIIDYKTGKWRLNEEELRNDIQMKFYVLGAYHLYKQNFRNFIFSLYYVTDNSRIDIEPDDPEIYEKEINTYIETMAADTEFPKRIEKHCSYCPAHSVCKPNLSGIKR